MSQENKGEWRRFDESPYAAFLGMKLVELAQGYAKVALKVAKLHDNWLQRTHGGLIMSLADQAFGSAINSLGTSYVAVQMSTNFLSAPTPGETIFAEGKVVYAGKSLGLVQITVTDSQERIIATASGTAIALERPRANPDSSARGGSV